MEKCDMEKIKKDKVTVIDEFGQNITSIVDVYSDKGLISVVDEFGNIITSSVKVKMNEMELHTMVVNFCEELRSIGFEVQYNDYGDEFLVDALDDISEFHFGRRVSLVVEDYIHFHVFADSKNRDYYCLDTFIQNLLKKRNGNIRGFNDMRRIVYIYKEMRTKVGDYIASWEF